MAYKPEIVFDLEPLPDMKLGVVNDLRRARLFVLDEPAWRHLRRIQLDPEMMALAYKMARFARPPFEVTAVAFHNAHENNEYPLGVVAWDEGQMALAMPSPHPRHKGRFFGWAPVEANWFDPTIRRVKMPGPGPFDPRPDEDRDRYASDDAWWPFELTRLFFLMLHQRNAIRLTDKPRFSSISSYGKRRTYLARTRVEIDLDRIRAPKRSDFDGPGRGPVRRHEYRGHFYHWNAPRSCTHDWQPLDDERKRWLCSKCSGTRTWKPAGWRGDATVGLASKDHYSVTHRGPETEN